MKSKIKTIFLILIIIVLAAVYAVIDKPVSVYDASCDTSKFQAGIRSRTDSFAEVRMRRGLYGWYLIKTGCECSAG